MNSLQVLIGSSHLTKPSTHIVLLLRVFIFETERTERDSSECRGRRPHVHDKRHIAERGSDSEGVTGVVKRCVSCHAHVVLASPEMNVESCVVNEQYS